MSWHVFFKRSKPRIVGVELPKASLTNAFSANPAKANALKLQGPGKKETKQVNPEIKLFWNFSYDWAW